MFQGQSSMSGNTPSGDIDARITTALKTLHQQVDMEVPEYGDFSPLVTYFEVTDAYPEIGKVELILGHFENSSLPFDKQNQRSLKFYAETPSGKSNSSQYVHLGTKHEVKNLITQRKTLDTIREYLDTTQRDFIEQNAG